MCCELTITVKPRVTSHPEVQGLPAELGGEGGGRGIKNFQGLGDCDGLVTCRYVSAPKTGGTFVISVITNAESSISRPTVKVLLTSKPTSITSSYHPQGERKRVTGHTGTHKDGNTHTHMPTHTHSKFQQSAAFILFCVLIHQLIFLKLLRVLHNSNLIMLKVFLLNPAVFNLFRVKPHEKRVSSGNINGFHKCVYSFDKCFILQRI